MFLDATYLKGRVGGQVVSRAVVVATGVAMTGDREVLGCAVGDSEDEAVWLASAWWSPTTTPASFRSGDASRAVSEGQVPGVRLVRLVARRRG